MKKATTFVTLATYYLLYATPAVFAAGFAPQPGCTQTLTDPNGKSFGDVPSLACLSQVIISIINVALLLVGAVTLIFLLIGAIKFIVARGDPKAIKSAQGTITYAIAGAILILLSYVIISLITNTLGLPPILQNFTLYQQ